MYKGYRPKVQYWSGPTFQCMSSVKVEAVTNYVSGQRRPHSKVTWPWMFRQHRLHPVVPLGSKTVSTQNKRSRVKEKGIRPQTHTRTCSQGASFSRTDDSQMFVWRYCDSHDHVCAWREQPIEWGYPLQMQCLELDQTPHHTSQTCPTIHGHTQCFWGT